MKTLYSIIFLTLVSILGYSQAPEAFNYQAVMRNASGDILTNVQIAVQISILQDSETGTAVYVERFNPTTTAYGLIAIKIGKGSVQSGTFSSIDWGAYEYYIMTEVDPNNGTDFTAMGTTQLLSVPYAMHSKTAESITGTIPETDPVYTASQASNITATDITNLGNLSGTNTGDQDLSAYVTTEADPVYTASQASSITATDITNLGNLSGTNTGDQDLSAYVTTEADPVYTASQASNITATDITNLGNLSGTNTGDQDLSGYITTEADPTWNGAASQSGNIGRTGNVGIGTTNPSAPLHVAGSVRIVDGTQGNRRMLQSDASGNASWIGAPGVDYVESGSGGSVSTSSSTSHMNTVTITTPGPGYVIVTASGSLYHLVGSTGGFMARIKISTAINDVSETPGIQFIRQTSYHTSSATYDYPFSVSRVFYVSTAGSHSFYLNIWHQIVNGTLSLTDHTLIGQYVPNRY